MGQGWLSGILESSFLGVVKMPPGLIGFCVSAWKPKGSIWSKVPQ